LVAQRPAGFARPPNSCPQALRAGSEPATPPLLRPPHATQSLSRNGSDCHSPPQGVLVPTRDAGMFLPGARPRCTASRRPPHRTVLPTPLGGCERRVPSAVVRSPLAAHLPRADRMGPPSPPPPARCVIFSGSRPPIQPERALPAFVGNSLPASARLPLCFFSPLAD
jgi:hypothetical protein